MENLNVDRLFSSSGISEGELLSGVMYIHSTQTLGVSEVCHFGKQIERLSYVVTVKFGL